MTIPILLLLVQQVFLPAFFIYNLIWGKERSRFQWILKLTYTGLYILFLFLIGRWDWVSYYLRFVFPLLFVIAVFISYRRNRSLPFFVEQRGRGDWYRYGEAAFVILLLVYFFAVTVPGYFYSDEPVSLAFPLQDGRYYIAQGGNSTRLNYHNANRSQKFALDIVELNAAGLRAAGIYPEELESYEIFGDTIHSPCEGTVASMVDGLPDHTPPQSDPENPAGNHVVIACEGIQVVMAHMQNGSVMVDEGALVTTGQALGLVGNSGNTTEPHLHIHAVRGEASNALEGEGVPLLFEGKFLMRNMLFAE